MAVNIAAEFSVSSSLQKEKEIFDHLPNCPYILKCFDEETTTDDKGQMFYNLLLEYASVGTLFDLIKRSGGCGLPESDVKRYTKSLLEGIDYIQRHGYAHCDLKHDNVLLMSTENGGFVPKLADFGLSKKYERNDKRRKLDSYIGGTILYMAPETLVENIQESQSDIWAIGCIVSEMLTGKKFWKSKPDIKTDGIIQKIADMYEIPEIPCDISKDAKDFLRRYLMKNSKFRFTAEMPLDHTFVSEIDDTNCSMSGEGSSSSSLLSEDADEIDGQRFCSSLEFTKSEVQGISIYCSPVSAIIDKHVCSHMVKHCPTLSTIPTGAH